MTIALRLSSDEDMLRYQPNMDELWPRSSARSWDVHHEDAVKEIDRRLRAQKSVTQRFELGRLSLRSREDLRDCATFFALHSAFSAATTGDPFYLERIAYYWRRAEGVFGLESVGLDYDLDNSGTVDTAETAQPFPTAFIRG